MSTLTLRSPNLHEETWGMLLPRVVSTTSSPSAQDLGLGLGLFWGFKIPPGIRFHFPAKIILKKRLENIEKSSSENFLKLRFEYELGARVHTLILESSASTVVQIISPFT